MSHYFQKINSILKHLKSAEWVSSESFSSNTIPVGGKQILTVVTIYTDSVIALYQSI